MYALWSLRLSRCNRSKETLTFLHRHSKRSLPTAPEIAADALLSDLDPKSIQALTRIMLEHLPDYDQPLGEYCRSVLGLDGRNEVLIKACGYADPNEAVGVVIRLAWVKACERRNFR